MVRNAPQNEKKSAGEHTDIVPGTYIVFSAADSRDMMPYWLLSRAYVLLLKGVINAVLSGGDCQTFSEFDINMVKSWAHRRQR